MHKTSQNSFIIYCFEAKVIIYYAGYIMQQKNFQFWSKILREIPKNGNLKPSKGLINSLLIL